MLGLIFTSIGTFFEEIATSIGKHEVENHRESTYTMAVLSLIWGLVFLGVMALAGIAPFIFSLKSLPTFATRFVLEVFQVHVALIGIIRADRSTAGFIRTGTIPLLLLMDLFLGYSLGLYQFLGIGLVIISLILVFVEKEISRNGLGFLMLGTINAVFTISLYKYNISNFNSLFCNQWTTAIRSHKPFLSQSDIRNHISLII